MYFGFQLAALILKLKILLVGIYSIFQNFLVLFTSILLGILFIGNLRDPLAIETPSLLQLYVFLFLARTKFVLCLPEVSPGLILLSDYQSLISTRLFSFEAL